MSSSDDGRLAEAKGLVEKPAPEVAPSTLSIIGRYILQPEVFEELDRREKGAGGEIQLTDAMARTIGRIDFHGLRFEGARFDAAARPDFWRPHWLLLSRGPIWGTTWRRSWRATRSPAHRQRVPPKPDPRDLEGDDLMRIAMIGTGYVDSCPAPVFQNSAMTWSVSIRTRTRSNG